MYNKDITSKKGLTTMKKLLSLTMALMMLLGVVLAATSCQSGSSGDPKVTVNSDGEYLVGI